MQINVNNDEQYEVAGHSGLSLSQWDDENSRENDWGVTHRFQCTVHRSW